VLLAVRTYDVEAAIPELRALLQEDGRVVALQNGVGTEEILAEALGRARIVTGALTVSAGITAPGIVDRYSEGGGVALATMDGSPVPPWLVETFAATGLPTTVCEDYRSLRWSKLLLNMLGAPISAILDVDLRTIVTNPHLFRLEQRAVREAGQVMDAQHIATVPLPGYPVPLARAVMRLPSLLAQFALGPRLASARGGHSPTMRADLWRNKSEVLWFNGAVAAAARHLGRRAPVNAALTELVELLADQPERRHQFRGKPDALMAWMREHGVRI
jgi:2-dehydropantoate 2-reductase